ncbi:MAG: DUF177 domain-containing protein [Polyangiaceae bacterium]|nr:DUF177 domain-containing protein [Polyangiaceae bacterium]
MPLVSISAKDIDTAGIKVDTDLPADWITRELSDTDAEAKAPGHLAARLSKTGNSIVVRGDVTAGVTMPCARCLTPATIDLKGELSLLLHPAPAAHGAAAAKAARGGAAPEKAGEGAMWARAAAKTIPEWGAKAQASGEKAGKAAPGSGKGSKKAKEAEYEFSAEEAEHDTYDGETVVLDDFIREALLLELPNFPLCSEACPGIRPAEPAPGALPSAASERVDPRLAPLGALKASLAKSEAINGKGSAPTAKSPTKAAKSPAKKAKQGPEGAGKPKTKKSNKE